MVGSSQQFINLVLLEHHPVFVWCLPPIEVLPCLHNNLICERDHWYALNQWLRSYPQRTRSLLYHKCIQCLLLTIPKLLRIAIYLVNYIVLYSLGSQCIDLLFKFSSLIVFLRLHMFPFSSNHCIESCACLLQTLNSVPQLYSSFIVSLANSFLLRIFQLPQTFNR